MNLPIRIISYFLAVLCITYSFIVFSVHSGSKFFLFWDALGIFFLLLGLAFRFNIFSLIPRAVTIVFASLIGLGAAVCVVLLVMICGKFGESGKAGLDYVIVLGAQVRDDGPSVVLNYRLEKAKEYLTENPETKCIVSGGQGSNEPVSEAAAMKEWLVNAGIDSDRIILEDQSTDTRENLENSSKLLPEGASVGIITNNFHICRALFLAKEYDLDGAEGIAAKSTPLYLPNNVMREVVGMVKDILVSLIR